MEPSDVDSILDQRQIVSRWLEYEGELRAGVLRIVLVSAFYTAQIVHLMLSASITAEDEQFHRRVTFIAVAWLCLSLGILVAIARHWLPVGLKYAATTVDLVLLTAVTHLGSGSASPLVIAIALVIVMAALRGSLPLIWYATLGCMISYMVLSRGEPSFLKHSIVLITLLATGLSMGQMLRMIRQVMEEAAIRDKRRREAA